MLQKKKNAVTKLGGGDIQVYEVDQDGSPVDGAAWKPLGYIETSSIKDETTQTDYPDETGNVVTVDDEVRTVSLTGNLMQTDKDLLDFLKEGCRNKYFAVYQNAGMNEGKVQEVFYGICKIRPLIDVTSGTKRPPFEIKALKNETALVFGDGGIEVPAESEAVAATIPAGEYYYIASNSPTS